MSHEEDVRSQARGVSEDASVHITDWPSVDQNHQPDTENKPLDHPPECSRHKCNWCGIAFSGKNCCESCVKTSMSQLPPSDAIKLFTSDPNACNACYRKHRKTREHLGNVLATISYTPSDDRLNDDRCDLSVFINGRRADMVDDINTELAEKRGIKLYLTCNLSMSHHSVDGDLYILSEPYIRTDIIRLLHVSTLQDSIDDAFSQLERVLDDYMV